MAAYAMYQTEIAQENITPILNRELQLYGSFKGSNHTVRNLHLFKSNNKYVKLLNFFNSELSLMRSELDIKNEQDLLSKVKRNLSLLLEFNPSTLKIEVSFENSFIITFKKGSLTCFIEQYFNTINDAIIANVYKNHEFIDFLDCEYDSFCFKIKSVLAKNI